MFGIDLAQVLLGTLSGLVGAVLTFLATRRRHQVTERSVFVKTFDTLTTTLRSEIERVNTDRLDLLAKIETLEARISELEASERRLQLRIAELEREREALLEQQTQPEVPESVEVLGMARRALDPGRDPNPEPDPDDDPP